MTQYASMTSSLLILRIGLVTYYASEIHENAHQILVVAGKCSSSTYSISVMWIKDNLILNVTFTTYYICNLTIIAGVITCTAVRIYLCNFKHSYVHITNCILILSLYSLFFWQLERLERKLAAQRVGVNIAGIFFVSRSLFASITSVIFTIEIFLLQAGQPSQTKSSEDPL